MEVQLLLCGFRDIVFIGSLVYRMRTSASTVAQRQRLLSLGKHYCFHSDRIVVYQFTGWIGDSLDAVLFFPSWFSFHWLWVLRFYVTAVGFWSNINRALVYGILSAILIGVYFALNRFDRFAGYTGYRSKLSDSNHPGNTDYRSDIQSASGAVAKIIDQIFFRRTYDEIKVLTSLVRTWNI